MRQLETAESDMILPKHTEVAKRAYIVAESFEEPFLVGDLAKESYFVEDIPTGQLSEDAELFLINVSQPKAALLAESWITFSEQGLNYWVTYDAWERAVSFLNAVTKLSISKVEYDSDWIKLVLTKGGTDVVHRAGFCRGLESLRFALKKREPINFSAQLTEPSLRNVLFERLIHCAKPIKRFIPDKLVAYLYIILEKLR